MTSSAECNALNADSKLMPACQMYFVSALRNSERHNKGATQTESVSKTASASSEFASRIAKYAIKLVSVTITVLADEFHNVQRLAFELHRRPRRPRPREQCLRVHRHAAHAGLQHRNSFRVQTTAMRHRAFFQFAVRLFG